MANLLRLTGKDWLFLTRTENQGGIVPPSPLLPQVGRMAAGQSKSPKCLLILDKGSKKRKNIKAFGRGNSMKKVSK